MTIKIVQLAKLTKAKQAIYNHKIATWFKSEWGRYRPNRLKSEDWQIKELNPDTLPITLIALDTDKNSSELAGVIRLKYDDVEGLFPKQNQYRLSGLYVDVKYRKRGVGLQLIKQAVELANKNSNNEIWLFTHSLSAKDYYLKQGWQHNSDQYIHGALASVMHANIKTLLSQLENLFSSPLPYSGEGPGVRATDSFLPSLLSHKNESRDKKK